MTKLLEAAMAELPTLQEDEQDRAAEVLAIFSPANDNQASPEYVGHENDHAQSKESNPEPQPEISAIIDEHPATPAVVPPDAEPMPDLSTPAAD